MAKNVTVTPADGDIQFENTSGTAAGRIEQNGDDLVISNAVGDVLFGDTNSDVYIGDGVNSVDLLFEQSGSIKAEDGSSGVTLTVGSSDTTLSLYAPQLTTTMTIGSGGSIDFTPDTGTVLSFDNQSIIRRLNANGGVSIGHDDQVIIAGGDTSSVMDSNVSGEVVAIGAEGGLLVYGFPNNNTSWSNRVQFSFGNNGKMSFGTSSDTNIYRSAANTLKTDDSFVVGDKLYITTLDANTSSTTALVMNGTEVEKRTLGSLAFNSTTLGTAASSASTDFVSATGSDTMNGTLTMNTSAVPFSFIESGHTGTGKYWRMPLDGGSIRFDVDTTNTNGDGTFTSYTDVLLLKANGDVQLSNYGAGILKTDDAGNISLDTNTYLTAHPSITEAADVNNSNGNVIQDLTFDDNGHVTATGSVDLDDRYFQLNYRDNFTRLGYGDSGNTRYHKLVTIRVDGSYDDYNATFEWTGRYAQGIAGIHVHSDNDTVADVMGAWYEDWNPDQKLSGNGYIKYTKSGDTVEVWVKTNGWREFDYIVKDSVTEGTPVVTWYTESTTTDTGTEPSGLNSFTNNNHFDAGYASSSSVLALGGGTMTGNIILGANKIAADTTSPTAHIQVGAGTSNTGNRSDIALLGGSNAGGVINALGLVNTAAGANSNGVALNFHNGNSWSPTGQIVVKQNSSGTSTDSGMYFYTYDGGLNNRMTIKNDGNIRLHAYGAGLLQTDANGNVSVDSSSYLTSIGSNSVGITELNVADGSNGQVLTTDGNGSLSFTTVTSGSSYTLPAATDSALGGVKLGYTESNKNYAVQLDSNSKAFVAVGWTDTQYSDATQSVSGLMSGTDKTKLDGIATGAEVNVQSDWNATTGDAFIQNKPTLFDGAYSSLTGVPSTFAPSSHNHDSRYYTESEMQHFMARALGWVSGYGNPAEGYVNYDFTHDAVEISGGGDSTTGGVFKAIRVKSGDKVRFTVMLKGSDSSTSGLYLRLYQHNGALPDGKTHVSNNASSSEGVVQEDDASDTNWEENRPVPSAWTTYEHTYTAAADGYVSLVVLNWSGHEEKSIYVKQPDIQFEKVNDASKLGGVAASSYLTAHPSITEASSNLSNSGRTYIQSITLDSNGHVTGVSTGTETVTNTNTTYSAGSGLDLTSTTFSIEADLRDGITHVGKDTSNYITFDSTNSRIDFYAGGTFVARMESDGDLHIKGDVIAFSNIFS